MCGIIGILYRQIPKENKRDIKIALNLLHHRGPDDKGIWTDNRHIQLGHTRLSILDLSPLGHQPMCHQNQKYWITFNGEIYNYVELREELVNLGHHFISKTDTEVILAAYSQWGTSCLEKLRGMFAFAIWDTDRETLFLARDRTGEKPLYYYYDQETFYFASELKALVSLIPHQPEFNPIAVDLYLHYQYVPEPLTPLQNIHKLSRAHYLVIDCKNWQFQLEKYWSLTEVSPLTGDPASLIRSELEQVINLTLRCDVPVGIALSGGVDSGAIAALAASQYKDTLQAFSIGYPGRPSYDERQEAEQLAKTLGLPFYDIELKTENLVEFFPELVAASDDPIADIAAYGHYSVTKLAADKGIKVMLNGLGGDELFWGYQWVADAAKLTQQKKQLLEKNAWPKNTLIILKMLVNLSLYQKFAYSSKSPQNIKHVLRKYIEINQLMLDIPEQAIFQNLVPDFQSALNYRQNIYTDNFRASIPENNPYQLFQINIQDASDIPLEICQILFDTWLVSNCLSLGDRVSMASSVEIRLPFLDYKLIELVMALRKTQPDHELGQKHWLKSALKDILPDEIINRPKRGFQPPTQEWMAGIITNYINLVKEGYLINFKIINPDYLTKLIKEFTNLGQHTVILYKIVLLETWYRQVIVQNN